MGNKMKGKLNKVENGYVLLVDNIMYATDNDKLSKQNCDEIFGVVDVNSEVESIVKTICPDDRGEDVIYGTGMAVGIQCFNKAMELNEGKVFTLEDIRRAMSAGLSIGYGRQFEIENKSIEIEAYIQSLQQPTEIEVEIEMGWNPKSNYCSECGSGGKYMDNPCDHKNDCLHWSPILDGDGCLILKKV
jgi:hypothetical protein